MARIKNVEAFCNFCGTIQKLEISGTVAGDETENKKWAKCKKCKQTMVIDLAEILTDLKPSLEGIENEDCSVYSPTGTFEVGQSIYHKDWDDFGKVVSKELLSNGQKSITVEFQKSGNKKLIESINIQP